MQKAFKYRIYPNKEQQQFLASQFGASRFIYNFFLNRRKDEYLNNKKHITYFDDANYLTELKNKPEYNWLYTINSQSLQASLRNLELAYTNFFQKRAKFPKFHARKNKQSLKIPQHFKIKDNLLFIPKLKSGIKIVQHRQFNGKTIACFISKTPGNTYYASILVETDIRPFKRNSKIIGIDLGIKNFVITSENEVFKNPKYYKNTKKELVYQQRLLSRKQKGSKNKEKQRVIVAKLHEYIANKRNDYLHKISYKLISENQTIITEDLSVKNMMRNHKLAQSISDVAWSEFIRQLEYKAIWYQRNLIKLDKFFPSSKTCNNCQFVLDELSLSVREWDCPNCKQHNDRDLNAALNIRDKGKNDLMSVLGTNSDNKQKLIEASEVSES